MKSKWKECEWQLNAIDVVMNSVRKPVDSLREKRESFLREYQNHAEKVNTLLDSFENDVATLKETRVPLVLQTGKTKQFTTLIGIFWFRWLFFGFSLLFLNFQILHLKLNFVNGKMRSRPKTGP
jgi:hypothetical protein